MVAWTWSFWREEVLSKRRKTIKAAEAVCKVCGILWLKGIYFKSLMIESDKYFSVLVNLDLQFWYH